MANEIGEVRTEDSDESALMSPVFKVEISIKSRVKQIRLSTNAVFRNKSQQHNLSRTFREASVQAFETPCKSTERLRMSPSEDNIKHHFMTTYQTIKHRRIYPRTVREGREASWDKKLKIKSHEITKASIKYDRDKPIQFGSLTHKAFEDLRTLNIRKSRLELWTQAELERKKAAAEYQGSSMSPTRNGSMKLKNGAMKLQLPSIKMREPT
mmetsp:Transcript_10792/g.21121  ORF Transcript_10792/g.21121 Transcript_10792/m.21121 type:complete len:211 (+) Transcript_10792:391-1023(+)